jgi:5'-deoxynucleotidase YfbR-like HD superfamily hydrolase
MEQLTHTYYIPAQETVNNKPILYTEILDKIKQTKIGELLAQQPPRWSTGQELSDQEHIAKYYIDPAIIPPNYGGLAQDLVEQPLSDADSFDHMQLCLKIGQILLNENQQRQVTKPDRDYLIALNLANVLHDIQEAYVGDSITKDLQFKIQEHKLFDGEVREELRPILQIRDYDRVFTEAFRTLFAERKLSTKYGVTRADLSPFFNKEDIDSRQNSKYVNMNELYESAHNITFFLAVLSNKSNGIADWSLKYDVMQNTFKRLHNDGGHIQFVTDFINHNYSLIKQSINFGNFTEVKKWLENNGRSYKQPNKILN